MRPNLSIERRSTREVTVPLTYFERLPLASRQGYARGKPNHADHKEDVADFKKESHGGREADGKAFAAKTLPTPQDHLKMAESGNAKSMHGAMSPRLAPPVARGRRRQST